MPTAARNTSRGRAGISNSAIPRRNRRGILKTGGVLIKKYTPSLRRQMSWIILLFWLLPMVIAATAVGWYLLSGGR